MKKILIVNHTKKLGGAFISLLDIVDMLKQDYDITVGIPQDAIEIKNKLENYMIKYVELKATIPVLPYFSGSGSFISFTMLKNLMSLRFRKKFSNEIMNLGQDLIILNSSCMFLSILKQVIRKIPVMLIVRETIKNDLFKLIYRNVMNKNFSVVTFISNYDQDNLKLRIPTYIVPDVYRVNPNQSISNTKSLITNDYLNVLYLGGSSVIKGGLILLKAIPYLKSNIKVYIAGNIDNKLKLTVPSISYFRKLSFNKYYRKFINSSNVNFIGFTDEVSKWLIKTDVVIFPSIKQHQPRPGIEAGVYNKPVILTDFDCTNEYFINGYNALTFKRKNYKDLASKINILAYDASLRNILGHNNSIMSMKYHNYEKAKITMLEIIYNILR